MSRNTYMRDIVVPRRGDLRWLLHLYERDVCGDSDVPGSHLHGCVYVRWLVCNMLAKLHVPAFPNLRGHHYLRNGNVRRMEHLSWLIDMLGCCHLRTAAYL